jgi:hypothetical protein
MPQPGGTLKQKGRRVFDARPQILNLDFTLANRLRV